MERAELKPLLGVRSFGISEPADVASNRLPVSERLATSLRLLDLNDPTSCRRATEVTGEYVGMPRISRVFRDVEDEWWGRLVKAETPEQKLSCSRIISAICYARGLNAHRFGATVAATNSARLDAEIAQDEADEAAAAEAAAIAMWR